jgi:hypothetical protein
VCRSPPCFLRSSRRAGDLAGLLEEGMGAVTIPGDTQPFPRACLGRDWVQAQAQCHDEGGDGSGSHGEALDRRGCMCRSEFPVCVESTHSSFLPALARPPATGLAAMDITTQPLLALDQGRQPSLLTRSAIATFRSSTARLSLSKSTLSGVSSRV